MKKILLICFVSVLTFHLGWSQNKKNITVTFYNVENLFDTLDNPLTNDNDFLPNGKLKWNSQRYQDKLHKLSKVLSSITPGHLPGIIGLCEVENRTVVEDLVNEKKLRKGNYKIIHKNSPDKRGIDCALVYNKKIFKPLIQKNIPINFPWDQNYKTRDVLYVKGKLSRKDLLHIFVTHWPSRRGGKEKSEKNRVFVAQKIKQTTDSILDHNPAAKIVIMGDLNDEPNNKAVLQTLQAQEQAENLDYKQLHNLMFAAKLRKEGSYNYRGNWNMLDNLIVSSGLLYSNKGYCTPPDSGKIFKKEWFCYKNKRNILVPSRTYGGPNYYGGYSDHFPVYFILSR